jgi:glycosyltransferase involved in cell wall biosynthesis
LKILHIIDSEGFYGAETVVINLALEQKRKGLKPTILNLRPCPDENSIKAIANEYNLDFTVFPLKAGFDILGTLRLLKYAEKNNFKIIHSHGYKSNILLGFIPRKIRIIPLISTLHGWCGTKKFSKLWFFEKLDLLSFKYLDAVVIVNKTMAMHPSLRNHKVRFEVINNGIPLIDFDQYSNSMDKDILDFCKKDGFFIIAIGRLSKEKGFSLLLEVMPRLLKKDFDPHLVLLGEGAERSNLEMAILKNGLQDKVFLGGYREGARKYIPLFDLFVMPSLTEGLPITLLEAMQSGTPIVASSVGGIPEVLDDGKSGVLINSESVEELETAILKIAEDKLFSKKLKDNATKRVKTKYSCTSMANKYSRIYARVCD